MKRGVFLICYLVFVATNMHSQQLETNMKIEIDTGYIQEENGILFYEAVGSGENIFLIHDGLIHHHVWDNQFQLLANDYHVIRYDRRMGDTFSLVEEIKLLIGTFIGSPQKSLKTSAKKH